ncbi:MAG: multiheme c-type cytochrome [Bradymonadia bacterium]
MYAWETPLLITLFCLALLAFRRSKGWSLDPIWLAGVGIGAICLAFAAWIYAPRTQAATEGAAHPALPTARTDDGRITSKACRACHPSEYASWYRTWHRTMTQQASPDTVIGRFDGQVLSDRGVSFRIFREGDGFFAEQVKPVPPRGVPATRPIVMTTGAHHMQNYWMPAPGDGSLVQLPFAWWTRDQRWIPTADSFLQPSPPDAPQPVWNGNCNPCHTVGSVGKTAPQAQKAETEVSEMGIACEACHGPSEAHVQANRSPLRRYLRHLDFEGEPDAPDETVANAARMSRDASIAACGQCHGLFMTRNWAQVNMQGDPFTAGDEAQHTRDFIRVGPDLTTPGDKVLRPMAHLSPTLEVHIAGAPARRVSLQGTTRFGVHLSQSTPPIAPGEGFVQLSGGRRLPGTFEVFDWGVRMRPGRWPPQGLEWLLALMGYDQNKPTAMDMSAFWPDGTVRTTGREMTGMLETPCVTNGEMTCLSCHSMHQGDPDDLMKPEMPVDGIASNAACIDCHPMPGDALTAHTHHGADSEGSVCYNCHMPRTSYGLMGAIRAHRVDAPSALRAQRTGRPDGCSLCHMDKPLSWTGRWLAEWYGHTEPEYTDADRTFSSTARWMLEGDAAQRAMSAWHAGWAPAQAVAEVGRWTPPLLAGLLTDDYAVVRYIAWAALRRQKAFATLEYDYVAPPQARAQVAEQVMTRWQQMQSDLRQPMKADPRAVLLSGPGTSDTSIIRQLLSNRDTQPVYIAE